MPQPPFIPGVYNQTGKGPYRLATANWKGGVACNAGDLLWADAADLDAAGQPFDKPAGLVTWRGALLPTQQAFAAAFRGVSTVRRGAGQLTAGDHVTDGPLAATGEHTFACAALTAAAPVGALVAVARLGVTNALDPQRVAVTADPTAAVGRVTEFARVGATFLTVEIVPATFGGPLADPRFGAPPLFSSANALTAFAGGGQANATPLAAGVNRVTTVATAADSVRLPPAVAGMQVTLINAAAANALNVFPATGEAINALAANTAFSVAANRAVIFVCGVAGTWHSVLTA